MQKLGGVTEENDRLKENFMIETQHVRPVMKLSKYTYNVHQLSRVKGHYEFKEAMF